jgi:hypothetical protein
VGQAARSLEESGFSTVTLTMTPEFHREIGIPRVAAIEYPYGRPVGRVHDREGQRAVLREALGVLERASQPGEIFHLPFVWPEEPKKTDWHPPEMSPLIKMYLEEIKEAGAEARREKAGDR